MTLQKNRKGLLKLDCNCLQTECYTTCFCFTLTRVQFRLKGDYTQDISASYRTQPAVEAQKHMRLTTFR